MSVLLERTQPYYVRVSGEQVKRTPSKRQERGRRTTLIRLSTWARSRIRSLSGKGVYFDVKS